MTKNNCISRWRAWHLFALALLFVVCARFYVENRFDGSSNGLPVNEFSEEFLDRLSRKNERKYRVNDLRAKRIELDILEKSRESAAFKRRLSHSSAGAFYYPGFKAAHLSFIWIQMLTGTHYKESYSGDFSWLFSKLDFLMRHTPDEGVRFISGLAPLYFVVGTDFVGASILMNELIRRAPDSYYTWFWGGYHAIENLHDRALAAELFSRAAEFKGAPEYLTGFARYLGSKNAPLSKAEKDDLLKKTM